MRTAWGALPVVLFVVQALPGVRAFHTCKLSSSGFSGGRSVFHPEYDQAVGVTSKLPIAARRLSWEPIDGGNMHLSGVISTRIGASLRLPLIRSFSRRTTGVASLRAVTAAGRGGGARRRGKGDGDVGSGSSNRNSSSSSVAAKEVKAGPIPTSTSSSTSTRGSAAKRGKEKEEREATQAKGMAESGAGVSDGNSRHAFAESLDYLSSAPQQALKGIGPKRGQQMKKLGINCVADLLWHLPTGIIDRRQVRRVADLVEGEMATVLLKVLSVNSRIAGPTRISCVDVDGQGLDIVLFGGKSVWSRASEFEVGETKVVSGKVSVDKYSGKLIIASPDVVAPLGDLDKVMVVQPTYSLTAGLSSVQLRSAVTIALESLDELSFPVDWIDAELIRERGWPGVRDALGAAHNPQEEEDLSLSNVARSRLAYDELLASQLVLAMRRKQARGVERAAPAKAAMDDGNGSRVAVSIGDSGDSLVEEGMRRLPFQLTQNQQESLGEILQDMDGVGSGGLRMFRLLQGDVGSGKTAVAFLAMLKAAEQGTQSCMLSPTEVLTMQHLHTLTRMAAGLQRPDGRGELRVEVLTGGVKGKIRQKLFDDINSGEVDILVATHAVLSSASTAFRDLGLAVVDEEQRFGVDQRDRLTGFAKHVLYLSATPIPRSLTLALFGDMEVSQLRQMPEGAGEIATTLVSVDKTKDIVERLKGRESTDEKVFWVLPQINKSESSAREHLTSAIERYEALVQELGEDRVSLLHGKMTLAEKNKTLTEFSSAEGGTGLRVLVSTSIIEVGIDVPRAGICVVENAEMFGLSQLHQIRGRLGRVERAKTTENAGPTDPENTPPKAVQTSHCILLYGPDITNDAAERLKAIRATRDGFLLAERDLQLRGPGEVLGVRQKGYMEGTFKVADLGVQGTLADHANTRARHLVEGWSLSAAAVAGGADGSESEPLAIEREAVRGAMGDADGNDQGSSDLPEGYGVLLALCGRGEDAENLRGTFSTPASEAKSFAMDGITTVNVAPAARARDTYDEELKGGTEQIGQREAQNLDVPGRNTSSSVGNATSTAVPNFWNEDWHGVTDDVFGSDEKVATSSAASQEDGAQVSGHSIGDATPRSPPTAQASHTLSDLDAGKVAGERARIDARGNTDAEAGGAMCFDDEADFLARSALENAELMGDDEDEYLAGFSPFSHPKSTAGGGGVTLAGTQWPSLGSPKSDGDHDPRQQQQQNRSAEGEPKRQIYNFMEEDLVSRKNTRRGETANPTLGAEGIAFPVGDSSGSDGVVAEGRVPGGPEEHSKIERRQGSGGLEERGRGVPNGAAATAGGKEGREAVDIIRRANLLEGGHTVILFDLETTGLSSKSDRVIQIAGKVMGSGDPRHSFSALVDPEGAYLSNTIQTLTGINHRVLAENNAQCFREVWPRFAEWLTAIGGQEEGDAGETGGGYVLIAHNAAFDHKFLVEEQARGGFDKFMMGKEMGIVAVVDSLSVLRQHSMWRQNGSEWELPRRPEKFGLGVLFEHLYGSKMPGAHTALGDVRGLESVLSAPGIKERWRTVASNPPCQIPVPRSLEEMQAAMQAAAAPRPRKPSTRGRGYSTRARSYGRRY